MDDTFLGGIKPVEINLLDRQTLSKVGVYPLLATAIAHPYAAELLRWQQLYILADGILELQLVHVPVGSTSHIHYHTQMLGVYRCLKLNQLIQLACWQQALLGLFVGVGMQLIIQWFTRQFVALQFANHLPVFSVFRSLATNAVALGCQLVVISHHTYYTYPGSFYCHSTAVVVLQPGLLAHQDIL